MGYAPGGREVPCTFVQYTIVRTQHGASLPIRTIIHGLCGRVRPTPRSRAAPPPAPPLGARACPQTPTQWPILVCRTICQFMPLAALRGQLWLHIRANHPTAVARRRHDSALFGTPTDLHFKGSGEMKWPPRGCRGRRPPAAGAGRKRLQSPANSRPPWHKRNGPSGGAGGREGWLASHPHLLRVQGAKTWPGSSEAICCLPTARTDML
jgi:hypothetical protein